MAKIELVAASIALVMTMGAGVARANQAQQAAETDLINAEGKKVGTARFEPDKKGVRITVNASGLVPGKHGIHIHEKGKCDAPDFKTAGSHFEPLMREHGLKNPKGAHAGDLPNLVVREDGSAQLDVITRSVALDQSSKSLFRKGGTTLVIHEKPDDQKSQPTGDSGGRVACGVIHKEA